MAKTKVSEWSTTPSSNTDIDGINIAEGCAPSGINDAIRELMAQLKDWQSGTSNDPMTIGSSGSLTLSYGTANGVTYLNGSKVLTSGSALTFDGTILRLNASTTSGLRVTSNSGASNGFNIYNDSASDLAYLMNFYNGSMIFGINNTEQMRLTSTGLGIGTSSPAYKLDVNTGVAGVLQRWNTGSVSMLAEADHSGNGNWYLSPQGSSTFNVKTGGSTRMTIDSSGNLLVGATSAIGSGPSMTLKCPTAGQQCYTAWNATTSGNPYFMEFGTEGTYTARGSITYNRAGGLTVYNTASDYRAKDISGLLQDSGSVIDSVPVYMGLMKGATQERPMFIAHETPAYAHTGEKDAVDADGNPIYQQMDASALIPVMWAEIQSLRKRLADAGI